MKYTVTITARAGGMSVTFSWDTKLSRDDVKSFFNPSNHILTAVIYPPDIDAYLEVGNAIGHYDIPALKEEIRKQVMYYEFDVILPESLRLWKEDLTREYIRLSKKMPAEKLAEYEARYHEIQSSITDKEEFVRILYYLVEEMKS